MYNEFIKNGYELTIDNAKGLYYETKEGKIYQREPDITAGKILLDQTIGKAKETMELQTEIKLKIDA